MRPTAVIPGASVRVCTDAGTGTPCTPLATIYSDKALTTADADSIVVADSRGRFSFYAPPGCYVLQISAAGFSTITITECRSTEAGVTEVACHEKAGADGGAKLQACHDAATAGMVLDACGFTSNQTAAARVNVSKSVRIRLAPVTWTATVADPGQTVGSLFNITASDVVIESCGADKKTVLKKTGATNQQALISSAANDRITVRNLKLDGDEANHTTQASKYYTCWVSSAGSTDLRLENVEVTGCGNRAIDFRGSNRVWINGSYFHQTGIATVGGSPLNGSAISADVDSTTHSTDVWCENNVFEEWGDAIKCGNDRTVFKGNILRGRVALGNTALTTESGLDLLGNTDATVEGNVFIEIRGAVIGADGFNTGAETLAPKRIRIINNVFYNAASLAAGDPRVQISQGGESVQLENISFIGNSMYGTRLALGGIDGFTSSGNSFYNIRSSSVSYAVDIAQGAGGVMRNFSFMGDTFDTGDSTLLTAFNVGAAVTAPGAALIHPIINYANVTTADVTFQSGAATDKVIVLTARARAVQRASADATAPIQYFKKSRGSNSSPATIANSDVMAQTDVTGYDGTNWLTTGRMRWFANSSGVVAGTIPTRWDLYVMNSSAVLTQAILVDNNADSYMRNFYPLTGATYDLGLTGTRWRDGWFSRNVTAAGDFIGTIGVTTPAAGTFTTLTATGAATAETYNTETNCSSSASPAVCADAAAGSVVIAAAATTVVVNTTKVTANSQIIITEDSSLGTKLSVTCNTTLGRTYAVTARTAATSFVITTDAAPVTNPACLSYKIVN